MEKFYCMSKARNRIFNERPIQEKSFCIVLKIQTTGLVDAR